MQKDKDLTTLLDSILSVSSEVLKNLEKNKNSKYLSNAYDQWTKIHNKIEIFRSTEGDQDRIIGDILKNALINHQENRKNREEIIKYQDDSKQLLHQYQSQLMDFFNKNYGNEKFEFINFNEWKVSDKKNLTYLVMTIRHLEHSIIESVRLIVDCSKNPLKIKKQSEKTEMNITKPTNKEIKFIEELENNGFSNKGLYKILEIRKSPIVMSYKNNGNNIIQTPAKMKNTNTGEIKYLPMAIDIKEKRAYVVPNEGDCNCGFSNMFFETLDF